MAEQQRGDRLLALGMAGLAIGFLMIAGGWLGAARQDTVPEQFPFMISGGLVGLGVVFASSALLIISSIRQHRAHTARELQLLREEIVALGAVGVDADKARGPSGNSLVAVGASSYHRPDCRLVEQRQGLEVVPLEVARSRELSACRVCKPAT